MSPAHVTFVLVLMTAMVTLAVIIGLIKRKKGMTSKNRVLVVAAILIDALELFKIVYLCFREHDPMHWKLVLPLFLCSIQLIALPLAAFSRGRLKDAALDFVFIFGILGAVMGTIGAGQNFNAYPVLSFDNVWSGLTHAISGFASIYIGVSGMSSMKKRNIPLTFLILLGFCGAAYAADVIIPYNYMFLMRGDGTPYDIVYNLVRGNPVLYPVSVVLLFVLYILVFYGAFYLVKRRKK